MLTEHEITPPPPLPDAQVQCCGEERADRMFSCTRDLHGDAVHVAHDHDGTPLVAWLIHDDGAVSPVEAEAKTMAEHLRSQSPELADALLRHLRRDT
jgi:hypothetical protein